MNSEKVKELKEFIEGSAKLGCYYKLANCDITMLEVLEYINELESENEQLKQLREVDYKTLTILRKANIELNECMDEMQDRIAELEKENARLLNSVETVQSNRCTTKCELTKKELKQFAEMLKEKALSHCRTINCYELTFIETTIDELLKEFINES